MRKSAINGWVLGSDDFKAQLEKQAARRVTPGKRGRPFKQKTITQADSA